jgi:hypothetical protein
MEEIASTAEEHASELLLLRAEADELRAHDDGDAAQIAQLNGVCKLQAEQVAVLEGVAGELECAKRELEDSQGRVTTALEEVGVMSYML